MFIALLAKTDIDIVALEKGELDEDDAVKSLIKQWNRSLTED
jgi:hypothetical protein